MNSIYFKGDLQIWPRNGNMLGGQEVNITGPCFIGETFFLCKWGDHADADVTVGETTFINEEHTDYRGRCIQPTMFYNGKINLSISLDDGLTFEWKAEFNIGFLNNIIDPFFEKIYIIIYMFNDQVDPLRYPPNVELVNIQDWLEMTGPGRLVIRWDHLGLGYGETDYVDVELWGYYEDDYGPHWDLIQVKI